MKEYLTVSVMGEMTEIEKGTTFQEIAKKVQHKFSAPIVLAKQNNRLKELTSTIRKSDNIEFFDLTDTDGMRVYHRSVSFLMIKAVKDLLGSQTNVAIEHSIYKSLYCEIREKNIVCDQELLNKIETRMKELVQQDIPITKVSLKKDTAIDKCLQFGMTDKANLFRYRRASNVNFYRLENFYDYFYGYMVPSTSYLKDFELMLYENGFLIRFPSRKEPQKILEFQNLKKISGVFMEQLHWCGLMNVNNVAELNDLIVEGNFGDLVRINEALHEKKIAEIADEISKRKENVKIILIAGPSSSGKTTFAHRLCVQLKVNGMKPYPISLDNYFLNRELTPVDEFGKRDYENIETLDLELFNSDLTRLIAGEKVELPRYNFLTGEREYKGIFKQMEQGEIIVIEGIHGLNHILTASIDDSNKFKIFVSAMTQLNIDDHNRISTSDSRLIRRIVRDHQFRGNDAAETISTWNYVTRGEERNIFPFQENADIIFNSATIYELSVLKQYIEPLLFKIDRSMPEYVDAKRIIKFLDYFLTVNADAIPNNSIMREFVGGSCFKV